MVERTEHPVPEAIHKVGEASVEMSAWYFAEVLGLREHLVNDHIRKMGLRFLPARDLPRTPLSRRSESGPSNFLPAYTFQIDRGRFENALGNYLTEDGVEFRHGCRVDKLVLRTNGDPHTIKISAGAQRSTVCARWVVDATGRRGFIRGQLGLRKDSPHNCNAVWFRLGEMIWMDKLIEEQVSPPTPEDIENWQVRVPNEQRWRSTNHLLGRGYWVWLIPLASGSVSVGIVADPRYVDFEKISSFDKAVTWLKEYEPEVGRAVDKRSDTLQDFRRLKHFAHSCKQVFSADRWALTGEAGVFTDPLYSPGSDFISIANTLITKMIVADLDGTGEVGVMASGSDALYLGIYEHTMPTWLDQYEMFGNPQVATVKTVWDPFLYFAVFGLLHHNDALTDLAFMQTVLEDFGRFIALNHRMQAFFREWHEQDDSPDYDHLADHTGNIKLITEFEKVLFVPIDRDEVRKRLSQNIDFVEDVMRVIMAGAATRCGHPTDPIEVDPMAFRIDTPVAPGEPPGTHRTETIARAYEMLRGVWHGELPTRWYDESQLNKASDRPSDSMCGIAFGGPHE